MTATNGVAGLDAQAQPAPDLIVSDIMMPRMDGYEFFNAVRSVEAGWRFLHFLTAKGEREHQRGKRMGAEDCVVKRSTRMTARRGVGQLNRKKQR